MRIFVAGATGVIGRLLVPALVAAGHDVSAMTRSERGAELLRSLGAEPHVADAFDADGARATTVQGVAALEAAVAELPERVVLRYGLLYGPGTWCAPDGARAGEARAGTLTAVADVSSFVHVADAAAAAVDALGWPAGGRQRLRRRAGLRAGLDPGVLRGRRRAAAGRRRRAHAVGARRRQPPRAPRPRLDAAPPVVAQRVRGPGLRPDDDKEHAMDRRDRGSREFEALMGRPPDETLEEIRLRSPELFDAVVEGGFGGTLARPELARMHRQIATVAILAALGGAERQLAGHAAAALRAGLAPSELRALCEHIALYAGFPRALNALAVVDDVLRGAGVVRPAPLRRVALADHETLVAQRGESGPPVVLLHALGLDWRMWEPVMEPLAAGRRVFAYDLRGHGWAAGAPAPYSMGDIAADLAGILDALGLERAHVVGLSFGGGIAQTAAIARPEQLLSLALLATTDHPFEAFEGRARSGETEGMEAQVVPSLTRWFTPAALAVNGWGVRYARERLRRGDPRDWAAAWRAFEGLDVQERVAVDPTLVLAGELDASTTPAIMSAIAQRIPGAVYEELPGTPHMQTLERPELVAAALDRFLPKDVSGARAP
jgi:3-oxoadipate enol-lactonase